MANNARIYSRLGQSGAIFGMAVNDLAEHYPIKVVSADMSVVAGLERFKSAHLEDFYNVGIAEQNMIGVAAGLADEGYKTIAVAQACFVTMRSFEQVRQYMGYMQCPVILVGISSGFALTQFGNTHYALEDLSLMRGIPGLIVLSPADATEAVQCMKWAIQSNQPCYIRLSGGGNNPMVYKNEVEWDIHKIAVLREGEDSTIFSTGSMVYVAQQVAERLVEHGLSLHVVNVHTIAPLDKDGILSQVKGHTIFTLEEHNITGGLGSAVCECVAESDIQAHVIRLGVKDSFMNRVGGYNWLLEQNRLTPELIVEDVLKNV